MSERLAALEGVIWDLDNTLYRFNADFEQACHIAAARAAVKGGADLTHEAALEICYRSYEIHGHSYRMFIDEYRLDKVQLHYDFHEFIDEKLIRKSAELVQLFGKTHLKHALVTHASGAWARRALEHIGLAAFFPDERIIPAEEINFERKDESRAPFEKALSLLELSPEKAAVVEDLAPNLRIPHEMGLMSVLVHYGQRPEPMPAHVTMDCNNAAEFLESVTAYSASG